MKFYNIIAIVLFLFVSCVSKAIPEFMIFIDSQGGHAYNFDFINTKQGSLSHVYDLGYGDEYQDIPFVYGYVNDDNNIIMVNLDQDVDFPLLSTTTKVLYIDVVNKLLSHSLEELKSNKLVIPSYNPLNSIEEKTEVQLADVEEEEIMEIMTDRDVPDLEDEGNEESLSSDDFISSSNFDWMGCNELPLLSDKENENLYGPVKQVVENENNLIMTFDRNGNLLTYKAGRNSYTEFSKQVLSGYFLNSMNLGLDYIWEHPTWILQFKDELRFMGSYYSNQTVSFEYDSNNRRKKINNFRNVYKYIYDENGKIVCISENNLDVLQIEWDGCYIKKIDLYNKNGSLNKSSVASVGLDNALIISQYRGLTEFHVTLDDLGRVVNVKEYRNNKILNISDYYYNSIGLLSEAKCQYLGEDVTKVEDISLSYINNQVSSVSDTSTNVDKKGRRNIRYSYSAQYEYEFDKYNNWISRTKETIEDGNQYLTTDTRVITYYE